MEPSRLAIALLCTLPLGAAASDMTVAGMTLGAPLTLPECARSSPSSYMPASVTTCWKDTYPLGTGWDRKTILFGIGAKPGIVGGSSADAYIRDGMLVAIQLPTYGVQTQESDLKTLTGKYGPPTQKVVTPVQNRLGATFDSITAAWTLPDMHVTFMGTFGRIDSGQIVVELPQGADLLKAQADKIDKLLNPVKL